MICHTKLRVSFCSQRRTLITDNVCNIVSRDHPQAQVQDAKVVFLMRLYERSYFCSPLCLLPDYKTCSILQRCTGPHTTVRAGISQWAWRIPSRFLCRWSPAWAWCSFYWVSVLSSSVAAASIGERPIHHQESPPRRLFMTQTELRSLQMVRSVERWDSDTFKCWTSYLAAFLLATWSVFFLSLWRRALV